MRTLAVLFATSVFSGCSSITMAEPRMLVSPYLALYQIRGQVALDSPVAGGPPQANPPQDLRLFGQDHHREDVGIRTDIGDGFGGLRVDYYKLDQGSADPGVLEANWGNLLQGDVVVMDVVMDEVRVGYLEPLFEVKQDWREHPLSLRFAAGGVLAYRDMTLRAKTDDGQRHQNVNIEGDVIYPAARFRASWRDVGFDAEYAVSPNFVIRGDFEGLQQDLELRATYTIPMRDVTFYAGYRYSDIRAESDAGGLAFDADLVIDGFNFGVVVTF
jgi:hypothetical protein